MLGRILHLKSIEFIITYVTKLCKRGNCLLRKKIASLQALKGSSEQKQFEDVVRPELTDKEKQRIEDQQLKQKAITEKDLVSQRFWWSRRELAKKSVVLRYELCECVN